MLNDVSPLEFFVELITGELNKKDGSYFLPKIILLKSDYDPYVDSSSWDLGTLSGEGMGDIATAICNASAPFGVSFIAPPNQFPSLVLGNRIEGHGSGITITGLANAKVGKSTVSGPDQDIVTSTATMCTYPQASYNGKTLQTKIILMGNFDLHQACCETTDYATCSKNPEDEHGYGTFTTTITSATIHFQAKVEPASDDPPQLKITIEKISVELSDSQLDDMSVSVDILTAPEDHRDAWDKQAEKAFREPYTKAQMIAKLNGFLASPDNLASFSTLLTKNANEILA